jgi:tRNA uridine 5-carboxymethylaminomethyl modification enzyme
LAHELGLASDERMQTLEAKLAGVRSLRRDLQQLSVTPEDAATVLDAANSTPLKHAVRANDILARPHVLLDAMAKGIDAVGAACAPHPAEVVEQVEIQVKYEGYIAKEQDMADRLGRLDHLTIPADLDFERLTSLSFEGRQKLSDRRPRTLGEASRISGVSPSDLSVLMVYLGR